MQRELGKMIGVGVHIAFFFFMFVVKKNLNRTLAIDSSNLRSRTSRRIYRVAISLLTPEKLSLSKYLMRTLLYLSVA